MATDLTRRQALALLGGLTAAPFARAGAQQQLAAAWQQADGSYRVGIVAAPRVDGSALEVRHALDIPTRGHGVHRLADGTLLATARRPGDWLVRWRPGGSEPTWHWIDPTRSFNGHVIASSDGRWLFTTETDVDTGASLIAKRDARSLQTEAEWPTHGIDAHELIWDGATLIVANGGVPTAPETGRVKRNLHTMDSSIVRLDGRTGALLGQWRLEDPRLSLRHLAWNADHSVLGIALQAEHDDAAAKHAAPILALFDGNTLRAVPPPDAGDSGIRGYGGSIAATPAGWAVSCPRANGIATFTPQGTWQCLVPLPEVCALAVSAGQLWAAGLDSSLQDAMAARPASHPHQAALRGARLDNHWIAAS